MGKAKVLIFGDLNLDIVFKTPKLPSLGEFVKAEIMKLLSGGVGGNIAPVSYTHLTLPTKA